MRSHAGYLFKFLIVGFVNTLIYFLLLWFFLTRTFFYYPIAIGLSFMIAMIFQYLANKRFTFKSQSKSLFEVFRYLMMVTINYFLSLLMVWFLLTLIKVSPFEASAISAIVVAASGFILSFFWVYKEKK
jgi:putative flippase GtrA